MKISKSLNTNFKKSLSTLELILTSLIFSVVIISILGLQTNLIKEDIHTRTIEILKLDLLSTKIYLDKKLKTLTDLKYEDKDLYFQNVLILKDVSFFEKSEDDNYYYIKLNLDEKIGTEFQIKK